MILVEGKGEVSGDIIKILVDKVLPMDTVSETYAKKMFLRINADEYFDGSLDKLKALLEQHNGGNCDCYFSVVGKEFQQQINFKSHTFSINLTNDFLEKIKLLMGEQAIKIS
jgi:hypothetical protein